MILMKVMTVVLVLLMAALMAGGEETSTVPPEFKTYPLGYADGSNTIETIKGVVGSDIKVFYDPATRQLLALASSNQHTLIAQLVQQLNLPPRKVRVTVQFKTRGSTIDRNASVNGKARVELDRHGNRSSVIMRPRLEDRRTEVDSAPRQQLLVTSGRQASLFIGENIPHVEWIMDYGYRVHVIEQRFEWQRVGAYLLIEPTIIGDGPMIRVRLTPELSGLVEGNRHRTRFTTASTDVTAVNGVPFSLGGLAEKNDFFSHFLVGMSQSGEQQTLNIEMTATILPAFTREP